MLGALLSSTPIVALTEVEQLLASVIVTVYVPALTFAKSLLVEALLHKYVYGVCPPITSIEILPVDPPEHCTFSIVFTVEESTVWFTDIICVCSISFPHSSSAAQFLSIL